MNSLPEKGGVYFGTEQYGNLIPMKNYKIIIIITIIIIVDVVVNY